MNRFCTIATVLALAASTVAWAVDQPPRDFVKDNRGSLLATMYDAWVLNPDKSMGQTGYIQAIKELTDDEKSLLRNYFKEICTDAQENTYADITNDAHSKIDKLVGDLEKINSLSSKEKIAHITEQLKKLHKRLREALKARLKEDPLFKEFLSSEEKTAIDQKRDAEDGANAKPSSDEAAPSEKVWSAIVHDPHAEVIVRMLRSTEILFESLQEYQRQIFRPAKGQFGPAGPYDPAPFENHFPPIIMRNPHEKLDKIDDEE